MVAILGVVCAQVFKLDSKAVVQSGRIALQSGIKV